MKCVCLLVLLVASFVDAEKSVKTSLHAQWNHTSFLAETRQVIALNLLVTHQSLASLLLSTAQHSFGRFLIAPLTKLMPRSGQNVRSIDSIVKQITV